MTYAPAKLLELRAFLQPRTGLSAGNLGIVGDAAHAGRGTSYHLGEDQLTAGAYSRQTRRDRNGLTNAASALDIGNHPRLRALSVWLVKEAQRSAPGTDDMREIIYSPDGRKVLRWDRERGAASVPRTGEADDSHLWHTHISWYRDSEWLDKVRPFRGFYGLPDTSGDDMPAVKATPKGTIYAYIVRVAEKATTYGPNEGERGEIGPNADGTPAARNALGVYGLDGLDGLPVYLLPDRTFVPETVVSATKNERDVAAPAPVPDPSPAHVVTLTVDGQTKYSETLP